jgi:hypothetical protein
MLRLGPEETIATEMRQRGVDCIAGYTVLPGELAKDRAKAKDFLSKAGITAAILMRLIAKEERTQHVPGSVWYSTAHYPSFWGYWDYGWSTAYTPGYLQTETVVSIETTVYSIEQDKLLWAGESETTDPKGIRRIVKDLIDAAGKEMRKSGLIRR